MQENKSNTTRSIEVRAIGKPSITALSESEQQVFYTTLLKRITELERQILIERSKCAVRLLESVMRQFYTQALQEEPQAIINYLIKKVVLFNEYIEIHYNSPIRISPDDSQGFSFYKKVKSIGKHKMVVFLKI